MTLPKPSCPACDAPYPDITWTGGSPPHGPDNWECCKCGHRWETAPAATMPGERLTCLDCGTTDPPPEMTCDGGTPGGIPRDHFVGTDAGCPHCGRLMAACRLRPCSAVRAIETALEDGSDG